MTNQNVTNDPTIDMLIRTAKTKLDETKNNYNLEYNVYQTQKQTYEKKYKGIAKFTNMFSKSANFEAEKTESKNKMMEQEQAITLAQIQYDNAYEEYYTLVNQAIPNSYYAPKYNNNYESHESYKPTVAQPVNKQNNQNNQNKQNIQTGKTSNISNIGPPPPKPPPI